MPTLRSRPRLSGRYTESRTEVPVVSQLTAGAIKYFFAAFSMRMQLTRRDRKLAPAQAQVWSQISKPLPIALGIRLALVWFFIVFSARYPFSSLPSHSVCLVSSLSLSCLFSCLCFVFFWFLFALFVSSLVPICTYICEYACCRLVS